MAQISLIGSKTTQPELSPEQKAKNEFMNKPSSKKFSELYDEVEELKRIVENLTERVSSLETDSSDDGYQEPLPDGPGTEPNPEPEEPDPEDEYVWVTPNTIDPLIHDMNVYDLRINGEYVDDNTYLLNYAFNDLMCKNIPSGLNHNTGYWAFLLSTGEWGNEAQPYYERNDIFHLCVDNTDSQSIGQFGINSVDANLVQPNYEDNSKSDLYFFTTPQIDPRTLTSMEQQIDPNFWFIPWLGIKTKLLP